MGINSVVLRMSGLRISDVIQGRSMLTIIWIYKGRDEINIVLLIELPINEERLIRNDWCERAMEGTMSLNQQEIIVEKKTNAGAEKDVDIRGSYNGSPRLLILYDDSYHRRRNQVLTASCLLRESSSRTNKQGLNRFRACWMIVERNSRYLHWLAKSLVEAVPAAYYIAICMRRTFGIQRII